MNKTQIDHIFQTFYQGNDFLRFEFRRYFGYFDIWTKSYIKNEKGQFRPYYESNKSIPRKTWPTQKDVYISFNTGGYYSETERSQTVYHPQRGNFFSE